MKELYELKEKLMDNLKGYAKKEMSGSTLEVVDKLTHTIKNLCKIIDDMESGEYSGRYSMDGRMTDSFGVNRGGNYPMYGMSYADGRGRGSQARRDSMGRYSSAHGMVEELREMMEDAPDEKTRMEFDRFIRKMESMG